VNKVESKRKYIYRARPEQNREGRNEQGQCGSRRRVCCSIDREYRPGHFESPEGEKLGFCHFPFFAAKIESPEVGKLVNQLSCLEHNFPTFTID
jgi:hypothetical protein